MSDQERVIQWVQELPDGIGVPDILTALRERYAEDRGRSGKDVEDYEWPTEDLTEDEWRQFVANGLRRELEEPREDIC